MTSVSRKIPDHTFEIAKTIPSDRKCKIFANIIKQSNPIQILQTLFPHSLYLRITNFTNQRIKLHNECNTIKDKLTDKGDIQEILSCVFIMSYDLLALKHY